MPEIAILWKRLLPLKVQCFLWLKVQNRVLTVDNLIKRGKILPNICLLCKEDEEISDHLFLHYLFASGIWMWAFDKLGAALVMPPSVIRILCNLSVTLLRTGSVVWQAFRGVILWEIWRERNRIMFEGISLLVGKVLEKILHSIWLYLFVTSCGHNISEVDVLHNLLNLFHLGFQKCRPKGRWIVPPLGVYKPNFDGSSLGNPGLAGFGTGLAGFGMVLRDCMGNVIFSYAGPLGVRTANYAEIFALLFSLHSFVERNLGTSYFIEGDTLNVVKWCKGDQKLHWELKSLLF
ncbi:uncharacterized protein LOC105420280 [Amborella trichopoda]|uniref:uncharacterized protein LOC105420280 n=1 Tax=Amborella trichopoda TaxID=13333 RepID=UPI0005D3A067|nr:uncharacterized protein LOC105420280 [Amborella trichopoda]|eukprot:XP_011621706.1 uncharacterized protein LOC105420280 [Amborella trichopoda]